MGKDREQILTRERRRTPKIRQTLPRDCLPRITFHLLEAQRNLEIPNQRTVVRSQALIGMLERQAKVLNKKAQEGRL